MSSTNRDAAAELAALRARLAAAEAVIAALPRCDRCGAPATRDEERDPKVSAYGCDTCMDVRCVLVSELPHAAPLRAYLALVEDGK